MLPLPDFDDSGARAADDGAFAQAGGYHGAFEGVHPAGGAGPSEGHSEEHWGDYSAGHCVGEEWGEPADFTLSVRPYAWTRGRTRPVQDLALETLVSTSRQGRDPTRITCVEHHAIVGLCLEVRSVAEVAALLSLPLGIARVLLADMIDLGLVRAHGPAAQPGGPPNLELMERVLAGLHRL